MAVKIADLEKIDDRIIKEIINEYFPDEAKYLFRNLEDIVREGLTFLYSLAPERPEIRIALENLEKGKIRSFLVDVCREYFGDWYAGGLGFPLFILLSNHVDYANMEDSIEKMFDKVKRLYGEEVCNAIKEFSYGEILAGILLDENIASLLNKYKKYLVSLVKALVNICKHEFNRVKINTGCKNEALVHSIGVVLDALYRLRRIDLGKVVDTVFNRVINGYFRGGAIDGLKVYKRDNRLEIYYGDKRLFSRDIIEYVLHRVLDGVTDVNKIVESLVSDIVLSVNSVFIDSVNSAFVDKLLIKKDGELIFVVFDRSGVFVYPRNERYKYSDIVEFLKKYGDLERIFKHYASIYAGIEYPPFSGAVEDVECFDDVGVCVYKRYDGSYLAVYYRHIDTLHEKTFSERGESEERALINLAYTLLGHGFGNDAYRLIGIVLNRFNVDEHERRKLENLRYIALVQSLTGGIAKRRGVELPFSKFFVEVFPVSLVPVKIREERLFPVERFSVYLLTYGGEVERGIRRGNYVYVPVKEIDGSIARSMGLPLAVVIVHENGKTLLPYDLWRFFKEVDVKRIYTNGRKVLAHTDDFGIMLWTLPL